MHYRSGMLASALLITSGCTSLPGGGVAQIPQQPFKANAVAALVNKYTDAVCTTGMDGCTSSEVGKPRAGSWLAASEACSKIDGTVADSDPTLVNCSAVRNSMSADLILAINYNFNIYSGNILANRAKSNFYIGGVRSGLETGATLIGGEGVKTVLSSLAALTGTIQSSANEEFYYEQSAPALIQSMEANRKEILAKVRRNLKLPYRDYPIAALVDDLNSYYRAGTMADAIARLQNEAVKAQAKAEVRLACVEKAADITAARACPTGE